jgi:hypothetical protein
LSPFQGRIPLEADESFHQPTVAEYGENRDEVAPPTTHLGYRRRIGRKSSPFELQKDKRAEPLKDLTRPVLGRA